MRTIQLFIALVISSLTVHAQGVYGSQSSSSSSGPGRLSREEVALINAYRKNPEPFRDLLHEMRGGEVADGGGRRSSRPGGNRYDTGMPEVAVLGARDVIDVTVQGGKIAFYGKRREYDPFSFRIQRGQTVKVVARERGKFSETTIFVSFRGDGLHFDVPEQYPDMETQERGLIVIGEDDNWRSGASILFDGEVNSSRSRSEAQGVSFNIRYVAQVR